MLVLNLPFKRSEERFSRNAETDLVCRLLLEKKNTLTTTWCRRRGCRGSLSSPCPTAGRSWPTTTTSFFINDTATTEIYTLSLHDALPIFKKPPPVAFKVMCLLPITIL